MVPMSTLHPSTKPHRQVSPTPRASALTTLSFGLVSVPCKAFAVARRTPRARVPRCGRSDRLNIIEFIPLDALDPALVRSTHRLAPGLGGDRGLALISAAMTRTGQGAVGRISSRGRED